MGSDPIFNDNPLHKCLSGQCQRPAPKGIAYCCRFCADAWESVPRYEPDAHSDTCHQRTPKHIKDLGY